MWLANQNPTADRANLDRLASCLSKVRAEQVIVMSTVAVYPNPVEVDEDSPIDEAAQTTYGKHRLLLERRLAEHFPKVLAVRLPGLFGQGLKKNALYDLLHQHELHKIHANSGYQFYDLDRLWADVSTALASGLSLVNFATQPVSIQEVAREAFGFDFTNAPGTCPARFDVRTRHSAVFGGRNGYLYNRRQVLAELGAFVHRQRGNRNVE